MMNFLKTSAVAAVVAIAPMTASAITILDQTDTPGAPATVINQSEEYTGAIFTSGGAGMFTHKFEAEFGSATDATVGVTVNSATLSTFDNLDVSWLAADGMQLMTVAQTDINVGDTFLSTTFGNDPDNIRYLKFNWTDSDAGNGFDFAVNVTVGNVTPVPVPAAGLMLLTAIGGAAAMRRRAK